MFRISGKKIFYAIFKLFENVYLKISVPTLPKIFRPVTGNTLIFLFGLVQIYLREVSGMETFQKNQE